MNAQNLEVLTNVIGAVESGGQVYGKRRYDQYSPPYHSTPKEHTITIGWYCAYGHEAQTLLEGIKAADIGTFYRLDNAGIEDMLRHDWEAMRWKPNAKEKAAIIALIDSPAGHRVQDAIFADKMQRLAEDCKKDYPGADTYAQMMYCEIRHLGGRKPADRIFGRCKGDYSLDRIMVALVQDQKDTSSSNQVGDKIFWSRHVKCRQFIEQYAEREENGMTIEQAIDLVLSIAQAEVGYKEKKSNKDLYSKTANAGAGNWTKYNYELHQLYPAKMDCPAAWCDAFCDWIMYRAFGAKIAKKVLCGDYDDYTPQSAQYYKNKGRWHETPARGDQIFFRNSSRICHTGLVKKVSGDKVYTIEGNANNAVRERSYDLTDDYIAGYGRPYYEAAASLPEPAPDYEALTKQFQKFMNDNYSRLLESAKVGRLSLTGRYGVKTRAAALAIWKYMAGKYYGADLSIENRDFGDKCKAVAAKINDAEIAKHPTLAEIKRGILSGRGFETVKGFQQSAGLEDSGRMNADTWYALFN